LSLFRIIFSQKKGMCPLFAKKVQRLFLNSGQRAKFGAKSAFLLCFYVIMSEVCASLCHSIRRLMPQKGTVLHWAMRAAGPLSEQARWEKNGPSKRGGRKMSLEPAAALCSTCAVFDAVISL
jgi:hypothetical protein